MNQDDGPFAEPALLPVREYNFYEGWTDDQGRLRTRTGTVSQDSITQWLHSDHTYSIPDTGNVSPRFRAISFPRYAHGRHKLGITEDAFHEIQAEFKLHALTAEALLSNNGVFAKFEDVPTSTSSGSMSLVFKVPSSKPTGLDSVSMTKHSATGCIYVLYYAVKDEDGLFSALQAGRERCLHPLFFVVALYCLHQRHVERYRKTLDDALLVIERGTRFGCPGMLMGHHVPLGQFYLDEKVDKELDYKHVVERLSYCQTEIAVIGHVARFSEEAGKWLVRILERMKDEQVERKMADIGGSENDSESKSSWEMTAKILSELEFSQCRAMTLLSQLQHLRDRVQSQTTLMLSVITQADAEYSAAIAASSKRDSTAMKTIAVLTSLFLPGTFVATFFSMTMFNWNSPSSGSPSPESSGTGTAPTVSPYIWVYWAVAIPLTLLVMVLWLAWSKREHWKGLRRGPGSGEGKGVDAEA